MKKVLTLCLGMLMLSSAVVAEEAQGKEKKNLLPDYKQKIGFNYGVGADLCSNYIWRGLYVGGLSVQADAYVGYGGLFLDMWWNIGANDWTFETTYANQRVKAFNPEVDMTLGFSRWGLTLMFMHMYYFDKYVNFDGTIGGNSKYFDFSNAAPGGGITQEWRIKYRVSDALPISVLWCTRTFGRDGYMVDGEGNRTTPILYNLMEESEQKLCTTKRAYSSYLELGYDIPLPHQLTLEARVGMTPWKSMYTGYQADFAVCNFSGKLNWSKSISEHCLMTAFANLMINPYDMHSDYCINGSGNPFLWNVGCGFYLQ